MEERIKRIVPITDRLKAWLLDNMPTGLWRETIARGGGMPLAVEHVDKVLVRLTSEGFELNEDYWVV